MTGFWYTRREIPLRQCIWYSALGWGGIVGSYMSSELELDPHVQRTMLSRLLCIRSGHQQNLAKPFRP